MNKSFKALLSLAFATMFIACNRSKSSHGVKQITRAIAAENILMGSSVGFAGARPEQWDRYEKLAKSATDKELLMLIDDTNAVVRCYAFKAVLKRKHIAAFPVLLRHLTDTAKVQTLFGCVGGTEKVGDFFLQCMNGRLTKKEIAVVDSVLK